MQIDVNFSMNKKEASYLSIQPPSFAINGTPLRVMYNKIIIARPDWALAMYKQYRVRG